MAKHILVMEEFDKVIAAETNANVKKALELFLKCDDGMKSTALYATGFRGEVNAENLQKHFAKLENIGTLWSAIDDMEWDIENP